MYVVGIAVIGGYSGLRVISGLSHTMLKQLRKELDEKTSNLKAEIDENSERDNERNKELSHLRETLTRSQKENLLLKGAFLVESGDYTQGIDILDEYISLWSDEPKPWMWKGRGYKRLDDIDQAIDAARKAIELDSTDWVYWYNLACYLVLRDKQATDPVMEALAEAAKLAKDKPDVRFVQLIKQDDDLVSISKDDAFIRFIDNISHLSGQN